MAHKAKRRVRFRLSAEQQQMLMRYVRNPPANSDLDQIRYDVAAQSGSLDIADRRMDFLATRKISEFRSRPEQDCALLFGVFPSGECVIVRSDRDANVVMPRVLGGDHNMEILFGF
jgi:hypothetical protein